MLFRFHILLGAAALLLAGPVYAQTTGSGSEGCSNSGIAYQTPDDQLTRAERIAQLDRAFYDSLAKFERCANRPPASAAQGGSGGSGADGGGAQQASVPSSSASGTESAADEVTEPAPVASQSASGTTEVPQGTAAGNVDQEAGTDTALANPVPLNGALPSDIPPSDNDSALQAQIRRAALVESDPTVKALIWNQYRKSKGLPEVANAQEPDE